MNPIQYEEKRRLALLRSTAEAQLASAPPAELTAIPAEERLHELRVHQIELEMQNEELRRAQAEPEESRDRYVDLYDFAPVGYLTLNREGLVDSINLTGAALLGAERKKLMHHRFASYVAPEDSDRWQRHFLYTLQHGEKQSCELALRRADGTIFHALLDCLYMLTESSATVRVALTDITKQNRVDMALHDSESRFRHLVEATSDWIWEVDENVVYTYASPRIHAILGYLPEEMLGKTPFDRMPDEEAQRVASLFGPIIAAHEPILNLENTHLHKDGHPVTLETSGVPIIDRDGKFRGYRGIDRDITARKQAEDQLQQLNATLEQRVREETAENLAQEHLLIQQSRLAQMGEMIGSIAHQWCQPLNALGLVVQNIQLDYQDNLLNQDALEDYVAKAMQSVHHMSDTIDDFRNFFKPNKEKQRFLVCDEMEKAIKLVGPGFTNNNITISQDSGSEPCPVYGYPNEFAQVVLNILSNAKDAIVAKKMAGKIHVGVKKQDDAITIAIRNNGGTIPEEILDKVFNPYFTTKGDQGSGIGLYMSKMIMANMGGNIAIHNADDGVEVVLTLPTASNPAV